MAMVVRFVEAGLLPCLLLLLSTVAKLSIQVGPPWPPTPCPPTCEPTRCPPLPVCPMGASPQPDHCNCCLVCAAREGETCGGLWKRPCALGLRCRMTRTSKSRGQLGTCVCRASEVPVCGNDGRSYQSLCALRAENRAASLRGDLPAVPVEKGNCGNSGTRSPGSLRDKYNFIVEVVEKVAPSVVHLELFRRSPLSNEYTHASSGSGFIVSEDGLIVTNAHVLTNRQRITVELQNGEKYEATVKDIDQKADLALIKIEPKTDLPVLFLGRSSNLHAGEFVVALGSPFSLQNTVTAGIVSTTQRGGKELGLKDSDMDYIQTDAIINHGNSGGPLLNLDGEVIGINTLKVTAGISFAIPSDRIRQFLAEFYQRQLKGKVLSQKKYLGLRMLPLSMRLLQEMKNQDPDFPDVSSGVFVYEVIQGTPAASSGMRNHDVITSINGQPVTSITDVIEAVKESDSISLVVRRRNEDVVLTIIPEIIS
ncbi:serine protease HTRA4 isoform X1 [Antechinus flavipes]|uniref:serine protease HTRA4 isoform X1 n=1 Tax=Antechinus flavipes TaxID=38775 RepID=UPI002235837E|nr:serine protease HTRA4 isoform X1 [Antechinus flavipes]